jgi:hypothetical protein
MALDARDGLTSGCNSTEGETPTMRLTVAGLPHRAFARERIIAEVEIARLLRATVLILSGEPSEASDDRSYIR